MAKIKQYRKYKESRVNINIELYKNLKYTINELARTKGDRHPELLKLNQMVQEHKELGKGISKLSGEALRERKIERETLEANIRRGFYKIAGLKQVDGKWEQTPEGRSVHKISTNYGMLGYETVKKVRDYSQNRERLNDYDFYGYEDWLDKVNNDPTFREVIQDRLVEWGYYENWYAFNGITSISMLNRFGRDLFIPDTVAAESIPDLLTLAGFVPKI